MTSILSSLAFLTSLGWPEIILIMGLFILLFGAKKLPDLARSMGKSIKEFKKATNSIEEDVRSAMEEEEPSSSKKIETQEEKSSAK